MQSEVIIVGGGLAGCEAAWQLAKRGIRVILYEMKPARMSPAHKLPDLAELVCSNSFKSNLPTSPTGQLKSELRALESIILEAADKFSVPAGDALAVDRGEFSSFVTKAIEEHPLITVNRREIKEVPTGAYCIIATGPLTSKTLTLNLQALFGFEYLYFYDAIAPIVEADSVDLGIAYKAVRYGEGEEDYLNCPMNREQYYSFVDQLISAEKVPLHQFEEPKYFEGCVPIEELAVRGKDTLSFGALRPVGLPDPKTGQIPYAVVQLRQDNLSGSVFSLVGCQTKLTYPEQMRVFKLIPGLENGEFVRCGSVHRNTYINTPLLLGPHLEYRRSGELFFAGQITGVEGYLESTATGALVGYIVSCKVKGIDVKLPPETTSLGALYNYIHTASPKHFQPMNINFGLFPEIEISGSKGRKGRDARRQAMIDRASSDFKPWVKATE